MKRSVTELRNDARVWAARQFNGSFSRPDWVSINLTLRCNLKCTMCTTCYDSPELSTETVFDIIDQVSAWGVKVLNPLGGEPFIREDLIDILEYASHKDLYVTVTTNGTLIDAHHARRIAKIPANKLHFNFSIDGFEAVHDRIRGRGMLARTLEGFNYIREADGLAGQPDRKILVNTVVNDKSLDDIPDFIRWCEGIGFSGIQLLNLFKHGHTVPREIKHLWIDERRWETLDGVVETVKALKANYDPTRFEIVNSPHQLEIMKAYYRGRLPPRVAPCFAGWKELYINATGKGIMCDGKLDFLNGQFGDIRHQTLRQMWESEEIHARRQVVKACESPCIQDCYLREHSNNMWGILKGIGEIVVDEVKKRVEKPPQWVPLSGTELTVELSDIEDLPILQSSESENEKFKALKQSCPVPFEAVYDDPFLYYDYRNKGYLNFNRGFMGLELLQKVAPALNRAEQHFDVLKLGWRGEPLLHPEFTLIFDHAMDCVRGNHFKTIRLDTHGALLNTEVVDKAKDSLLHHRFVVHLDAATPEGYQRLRGQDRLGQIERNLDYLLYQKGQQKDGQLDLILAFTARPENEEEAQAFAEKWLQKFQDQGLKPPQIVIGALPPQGDVIWFRRLECDNFLAQLEARKVMERIGVSLGKPALTDRDSGAAPQCAGPFKTPTISWDGKVTLCSRDRRLLLRAGEITSEDFAQIWWAKEGPRGARQAVLEGRLHQRNPCRDCRFPFSPNAPVFDEDEMQRYAQMLKG